MFTGDAAGSIVCGPRPGSCKLSGRLSGWGRRESPSCRRRLCAGSACAFDRGDGLQQLVGVVEPVLDLVGIGSAEGSGGELAGQNRSLAIFRSNKTNLIYANAAGAGKNGGQFFGQRVGLASGIGQRDLK